MKEPLAKALRFSLGERASQAERLHPGQQVLIDQRDLKPGHIRDEIGEGKVPHPGVFAGADPVLNSGSLAVAKFQRGDLIILGVGEKTGEVAAVMVGELELAPGWARSLRQIILDPSGQLERSTEPESTETKIDLSPGSQIGDQRTDSSPVDPAEA
jgi:hypothetical protein